ncbi:MAG: MATE family efflux transporter [Lachnospiraceae bacterium]|nr:MATE family efflux transporter [Lachnospiraceae bacterium]
MLMGTAPFMQIMFKMGIPAMIAQLINIIYNIVDRIYIGHMEGDGSLALTGVGVTLPVLIIVSAFSAFAGSGGAPLAAIALGRGERRRAQEILGNVFLMLLVFSVVLTVLFQVIKEPVLYLFGASDATIPYAMKYLTIYLWGTVVVQLALGLNPFISAQGKTGIAMISVMLGAGLNILLDPVFIFGLNLGVEGAAIATVISQFCSALFVVGFLLSEHSSIRIKKEYLKLSMETVGRIAALGVSPFIMQSTECMISVVFNSNLQKYGGDLYVGSLVILQSIMQLILTPISGFNQGVQPIISYNYGAGDKARVKGLMKRLMIINVTFSAAMTALVMVLPGMFAKIFTPDTLLIELVKEVLPIFVAGCLVFGVQMSSQTTFLGLGQAKISLFMALLRKVILLIPLAVIFPRIFGVMGIYWAEPIADALAATICGTTLFLRIGKILNKEEG